MLFTELHELPDGFAWDFQLRNRAQPESSWLVRLFSPLRPNRGLFQSIVGCCHMSN